MNYVFLLDSTSDLCRSATSHFSLPQQPQRGETALEYRAPNVHEGRLPNSRSYAKEAPYIIIQFLTSQKSIARIRIIFCVYNKDEEEGAIALLNVMDAVRLALSKAISIGGSYTVVRDENGEPEIETLVYPDDTAPFYGGEISIQINCPAINREIDLTQA